MACAAYLALAYAAPAYFAANPLTAGAGAGLERLAPFAAGIFALTGAASLLRSHLVARRFDKQRSTKDIRQLSWQQFESIVAEYFRRKGYVVRENESGGPDDGIDVVVTKNGQAFFVQCKQWQSKVGVKPVRELFGVMKARGADGCIFVSSGAYTKEAQSFAAEAEMELIDGEELAALVRDVQKKDAMPKPELNERAALCPPRAALTCTACGSGMALRTAKRGPNAGREFWGCTRFPQCRSTRPA